MAIEKFKPNENSNIKHIYGIVSGKGGVGKSFVTSTIASELRRQGKTVGILDADITGPSIPKSFGITDPAVSDGKNILHSNINRNKNNVNKLNPRRSNTTSTLERTNNRKCIITILPKCKLGRP